MFKGKRILITGGTGSWGSELVTQLLETEVSEIIIYSRNEYNQVMMRREFNNQKLTFTLGDVRDSNMLHKVTKNIDYVFHLAALKHIDLCEKQPTEVIKTNIKGVRNIIDVSIENNVEKVINISSDKATEPINLYGMTKAVGEKLFIQANQVSNTEFICIRGGNVLGSSGSVVPFFINQVKKENQVTLTHKEMTRFFLTLHEAIHLIFYAMNHAYGGEIFVMNMPSYRIKDVAEAIIKKYGKTTTRTSEIGIRPGEKIHELLISDNEKDRAYIKNKDYYVILPSIEIAGLGGYYNKQKLKKFGQRLSSIDNLQSMIKCEAILRSGGFI